MRTSCETVPVKDVGATVIDSMWQLFEAHYLGASREMFVRDLRRKHQALLLWRGSRLIGFSSQLFDNVDTWRVVYSGDVIIAPEARDAGSACFFHHWAKSVWQRCDWWCALASGPRTFRIPHTFYRRVTPDREGTETREERELRHRFVRHAYGNSYDAESGIVRLPEAYTLKEHDSCLRGEYPMDDYFRAANPGWRHGDEMVSLVSLHPENWKPIAMRMLTWGVQDAG